MAHFAQLNANNDVLQVVVINNSDIDHLPFPESEPVGVALCQSFYGADTIWKQTSYNGSFRRQYAAIGGFYYPSLDVFVSPSPFPSWVFQDSSATWQAPIPMPNVPTGYIAVWNEEYLEWNLVINPQGAI